MFRLRVAHYFLIALICQGSLSAWSPQPLSHEVSLLKMVKNGRKAIEEHIARHPDQPFATVAEATQFTHFEGELAFSHTAHELQGPRITMEDAKFFKEINEGVLVGVFDGHAGSAVADYANSVFSQKFERALAQTKNIRTVFEQVIDEIEKECFQRNFDAGSTAVVSFIEKKTGKIYTATLADSEANIYRQILSEPAPGLKSIPLSTVRDWSSPKDATRASILMNDPLIAETWPQETNPKYLRLAFGSHWLNVSRALGDQESRGYPDRPGIIHKPKITVSQVRPGDILILGCDGLKDYVSEKEMVTLLANPECSARTLVEYAVNTKIAQDNVSVIMVKVAAKVSNPAKKAQQKHKKHKSKKDKKDKKNKKKRGGKRHHRS